jgi:hypothetical protein
MLDSHTYLHKDIVYGSNESIGPIVDDFVCV